MPNPGSWVFTSFVDSPQPRFGVIRASAHRFASRERSRRVAVVQLSQPWRSRRRESFRLWRRSRPHGLLIEVVGQKSGRQRAVAGVPACEAARPRPLLRGVDLWSVPAKVRALIRATPTVLDPTRPRSTRRQQLP